MLPAIDCVGKRKAGVLVAYRPADLRICKAYAAGLRLGTARQQCMPVSAAIGGNVRSVVEHRDAAVEVGEKNVELTAFVKSRNHITPALTAIVGAEYSER